MCRILAVSDSVDPALYDHFNAERWRAAAIELVISCGDLSAEYLSYLVSRFDVPLYYVHGNHDGAYDETPPEGAESIDGRLVTFHGLRILGLGDAPEYNGGPYQRSEASMARRIFLMKPRIWRAHGIDLVVTHAPPRHCPLAYKACATPSGVGCPCVHPDEAHRQLCNDAPDRAHRGFPAFTDLIDAYHPRYFLHGHSHLSFGMAKRVVEVGTTKVVDCHGYYLLDVE
jgi:Icc-related predicted phosphoesterase